jgi:hypothetical protein
MLVFIDESGCPGFKLNRDSDPVFVIGMVIFENGTDASVAQQAIEDLRRTTRHHSEFKFSKCRDEIRDAFFRAVCGCEFTVRALVVEKKWMVATGKTPRAFFRSFAKELLKSDDGVLRNASVRIDGTGRRELARSLRRYFSAELRGKVREVRLADSARDPLIQLADMCVGAIARAYRDRPQSDRWLRMLNVRNHDIRRLK